jgi:hypothetical protein
MITSIILALYSDNTSKSEITYSNGKKAFISYAAGVIMVANGFRLLQAGATGNKSLRCNWKAYSVVTA